jgi:alkanesulfonate monooxygenase SsuD/methylene tetrahydromethanopterin reductase-like flavin-dependent oxidoreductase (luciferase family)
MEVWIRQSMPYHPHTDGPMPFPVPGWMWDRPFGEGLYSDRMKFIRRVDELGYDGIIFTEHHYGPNGGLTPSPTVMMSAATQVTERIKLVTMGISLALYPHPVRVAEELAMVDNLSHGRLVFGLISSGAQNLYSYSVPVAEERGRHNEAYDLIVRAWTEPSPFEWHSDYFDYPCVSILPRPVQVPHPRVWTTASADQTLQWAAEKGIGMIASGPTTQCADILNYYQNHAETQCGWTPTADNRGTAREFFIAPTKAKVQEMLDEIVSREGENAYPHMFTHPDLQELEQQRYQFRTYSYKKGGGRAIRGVGRGTAQIQSGQFIVGDPDSLTEQILEQHRLCGNGVLVIRPEMGNLTLDQVADGLDLFAREVLPVLAKI